MKRIFVVVFLLVVLGFDGLWAAPAPPDYSLSKNWISQPREHLHPIDVFFMHPTTYYDQEDGMNASVNNDQVNQVSDRVVAHQGGVFRGSCNIFAPRYRQASIKVLSLSETKQGEFLDIGVEDLFSAFKYYLAHNNEGRPFILAGHSQGSNIWLRYLKKYRQQVPYNQLVAAYLIGWTITDEDLNQIGLRLADSAQTLGGLITWNTISEGGKSPVLLPGARCVNPLDWSAHTGLVPASANIYALISLPDGRTQKIPNFTSARIGFSGGLVIPVPTIDDQLDHGMGPGVYHAYDYDFFYGNFSENVSSRCAVWLNHEFSEKSNEGN